MDLPRVRAELERVRAELAAYRRVLLPGGDEVIVMPILGEPPESAGPEGGETSETDPRDELRARDALARLHVAITQIDAAPNDNSAARLATLEAVLARDEFRQPFNLWQRLRRWIRDLIRRIFARQDPDSAATSTAVAITEGLAWVVVVVAAGLILFSLAYWLQRILGNFVAEADARRAALDGDSFPLTSQEARRQARSAAEAGDYRAAVRRLYLSALLLLDERRLIRYDRFLTNREVLAQLPEDNPARAHMEPVVETFDTVWYGVREPDASTFAAYEREIDRLSDIAHHMPPADAAANGETSKPQEDEKEAVA